MRIKNGAGEVYDLAGRLELSNAYYVPHEAGALRPTDRVYVGWTVEELYAAWDALMDAWPNYISRRIADYKDASGTYDLRCYEMIPESGVYDRTIYIQAGAHGNEIAGQMCVLRVAQIICDEWLSNAKLAYLRNKVRVVINPLANPWGKAHVSLGNSNGINGNRNYDGFWISISGGVGYNSGNAPFEIPEARWVRDIVERIGAGNIHYAFDFHDAGEVSLFGDYWVNFNAFLPEARNNVMQMISYLCAKNVEGEPNIWHCADTGTYGTFANWANKTLGIPASTVEHCYSTKYLDADFMDRAVEVYLNTVLVNACGDYLRPVDVADGVYFRLRWYEALGEAQFNELNNGMNAPVDVLALFDTLVDDEYISRSAVSVLDSAANEIHYYALTPKAYTKTIVLLGGYTAVRTNGNESAALLYKFARLLRDYSDAHPALRELRDNCRIVLIPYISAVYDSNVNNLPEYSGNLTADWATSESTCIVNLRAFLADIGDIDWFIYAKNRMHEDLADDPTENFSVPAGQTITPANYADHLNRTGSMTYAVTELSGGLGGYLETLGIPSLRHETAFDTADYEAHKMDYPTADGTTAISTNRYVRLNAETARRLSVLVNLMQLG